MMSKRQPQKKHERYSLEASPFYRIGRADDLARVLGITKKELRSIIVRRVALYSFRDVEIGGKARSLAVPIWEMREVHERVKVLLNRIQLPNYIYSPRKGKSSVDNAVSHVGSNAFVKLDIKQFYPSTTDEHVFQFFRYRLRMIDDVAGRLTKICTVNGRVPFGSPLSPVLCALVHDDVFSRISQACEIAGDTMTLWVDDVTISGNRVDQTLIHDIRRLINAKRMQPHKSQRVGQRTGVVITGTFLNSHGISPANRLHVKMREKLADLKNSESDEEKYGLVLSLIGLVNHFMTIYAPDSAPYLRLKRRLAWLHNLRRDLHQASVTGRLDPESFNEADANTIPWE